MSVALSLLVLLSTSGERAPAKATPRPFERFVEDYFDAFYSWKPSEGTAAGFHQYDHRLEDWSAAAIAKRIETLQTLQNRLNALRKEKLNSQEEIDAEILNGMMHAELLDLATLASWRKNPMNYISTPASAIDGLMKRSFAPASERLRSVTARLEATPALFQALRTNVVDPPKEFTDLALHIGQGSVGFFMNTVREWAREAAGKDTALFEKFEAADAAVVKSLTETVAWLKDHLLPRSRGSYAVGARNYSRQLLYEDLVDIPLDRLLAIGEANLRKDQEAFIATAKQINPNKTPREVMHDLADDHPTETELIPAVRATLEKCRQFIVDKHLITIPSEVRPAVLETPPYGRTGVFASMDTPGAYETRATEAFYYVTPVEKDWDARHKEEHLRLFNRPVMQIVTIHEAFPGHYIQFLYAKQYRTKTRKLTYCDTNVEGWAHYCEQMVPDEGYGAGDPRIRLAQLSEALLRDCRYVVGIKLHTQGLTVEEGAKIFEKEGFQEPSTAYAEARRGTYNPTYLSYTLGKLMIYKLRDDYRQAKGSDFRLEEFHNAFIREGGIPIRLIRRILLPGDKRPAL
jgi:uncharacterized protein (DUF885 family)